MALQKVVYVHLKNAESDRDSDFFFGSIKAIFDYLTTDDVGIQYKSLTNALRGRNHYENKRVLMLVGTLLTKRQTSKQTDL